MSTRLTRRGRAVLAGAVILAGLAVGITTGDVCYWGRCSEGVSSAPSDPLGAEPEPDAQPVTPPAPGVSVSPPNRNTPNVSRARARNTPPVCSDPLNRILKRAGFTGENLREAWAIAMRESNGRNIGPGHPSFNGSDYGLFQFNRPTWGDEPWWSETAMVNPDYNAAQAYRISKGGSTWAHWGLDGSGRTDASLYGMWSADQVWSWITEPYQRYYRQYPCTPPTAVNP